MTALRKSEPDSQNDPGRAVGLTGGPQMLRDPLLARLYDEKNRREAEFARLYGELASLDQKIARIERLRRIDPSIEALIDSLK